MSVNTVRLTGAPDRRHNTDDDGDENGVLVSEEDFHVALSQLVPSLPASELDKYDALEQMFTRRRHGNEHLST